MSQPSAPPGRVAMITVDWLPAWMLATYGTTWVATPQIDRLAAGGVTLDNVVVPSFEPAETLAALVPAESGDAVLVTDSPQAAAEPPGEACDRRIVVEARPAGRCGDSEEATCLGRLFAAAVAEAASARRLLWVHAGSLGVAWDAPLEFRDSLADPDEPPPPRDAAVPCETDTADPDLVWGWRQAFAGQVMLLDRQVGRLLAALDEQAAGGRWSVVLAGLRGMPLGLHGQLGIGNDLPLMPYGEVAQVPLVIADAAGRMAGQRFGGLVVPEDVGRLVQTLLGGEGEPPLAGLLERWEMPQREQVITLGTGGGSIVTPAWRLVARREADSGRLVMAGLFARPDDFHEQNDVADRCRDIADELLALLPQP
jgi:hypothetical protein